MRKVYVAVRYEDFDCPEVKGFSTLEKAQKQLYVWGGQRLFDAFHRAGVTIEEADETEFLAKDITGSWVEYDKDGGIESVCWGSDDDNKTECWIEEVEVEIE